MRFFILWGLLTPFSVLAGMNGIEPLTCNDKVRNVFRDTDCNFQAGISGWEVSAGKGFHDTSLGFIDGHSLGISAAEGSKLGKFSTIAGSPCLNIKSKALGKIVSTLNIRIHDASGLPWCVLITEIKNSCAPEYFVVQRAASQVVMEMQDSDWLPFTTSLELDGSGSHIRLITACFADEPFSTNIDNVDVEWIEEEANIEQ